MNRGMNRGIEFEQRDDYVIVWKTWPGPAGSQAREEVCRLMPYEALTKSSELRLAASDARSTTLPPGVR
jgi:hypothetical protein